MSYDDTKITAAGVRYCCRDGCSTAADDGHEFCGPCLDWLRCDADFDPLAAGRAKATLAGMAA